MKKTNLAILSVIALIISVAFYSCQGDGGSRATGTVAVYITDDMSMLYSQVTATIDDVQLMHTGTGETCDVLTSPTRVNIANLSDIMQLIDVADCPAGPFNRIHIEFEKNVQLMSGPSGTGMPTLCSFVSFKDETGSQPNLLQCDPATNICTLNVNGAVNVLAGQQNKLALDFNLKEFDVAGFGTQACAVTMKVSPLNASDMGKRAEAITGLISGLSVTDQTFDLTRGNRTFSVLYSGITSTDQPGLDTLLQLAQDDRLRARVTTSSIDFANNTIIASGIIVKVEGTVSNLVSGFFSLNYGPAGTSSIEVDYTNAIVEGTFSEESWVNVKLYGYSNVVTSRFLARKVEVESAGMMTED